MERKDKIARLKEELGKASDNRHQADILNELAAELCFEDSVQAIRYAEKARQLCSEGEQEGTYVAGLARAQLNLARAYNQRGNYMESLSCLLKAQPLFEEIKDENGLMWVNNELGRLYFFGSDYPRAMEHYLKTMELARRIGHSNREAASHNNIGQVHNSTGNYQLALETLEEGLGIAIRSGDRWVEGFILGSMAESYYHLQNYEKSLEMAMKSLDLARENRQPSLINGVRQVISWSHFKLGDYDLAKSSLLDILATARESGDKRGMAEALKSLGEQACKRGQYKEAVDYVQQALGKARELGERAMEANCLRILAEAHKGLEDFRQAYEYLEASYIIDKELFNEKSDLRLKMLSIAHRLENTRREAEIYRLRNMMLQREVEDQRRVRADLEYLADHDHLTGLFNRRSFFRQGAKLLASCLASQQPFSLLMLDVDHFKQVNDRHGHLVGDEVLREMAELLRQNLRQVDLICRYGGEEFAILLPEMDEDQAFQLSQRICRMIAEKRLDIDGLTVTISISFGVAQASGSKENIKSLVYKADQALYAAKNAGRNCVRAYSQIENKEGG